MTGTLVTLTVVKVIEVTGKLVILYIAAVTGSITREIMEVAATVATVTVTEAAVILLRMTVVRVTLVTVTVV